MKNIFFILFTGTAMTGCDHSANQLREMITGADSVAINYFTGDGKMDTVTSVRIIRDKSSIGEITSLVTIGDAAIKNNCGYDGSIHFFKNDRVVQDIYFSSNEGCRQFLFRLNGKDVAGKLNDKAKAFLMPQKKAKF